MGFIYKKFDYFKNARQTPFLKWKIFNMGILLTLVLRSEIVCKDIPKLSLYFEFFFFKDEQNVWR